MNDYIAKKLNINDLNDINKLHQIESDNKKDTFLVYSKEEIEHILFSSGAWFGVRNKAERLIACASYNFVSFHGVPIQARKHFHEICNIFYFGGCIVDSDFRGNGIQAKLLNIRLKHVEEKGLNNSVCWLTAHPQNIHSIENIKESGFIQKTTSAIALYKSTRHIFTYRLAD